MFWQRRLEAGGALWLLLAVVLGGCAHSSGGAGSSAAPLPRDLPTAFAAAMQAEAEDAGAAGGYLDVIDVALAQPDDPWALGATLAALDALLSRRVADMPQGLDHAIVHRSREGLVETARRLQESWSRTRYGSSPVLRGLVAGGLHQLALRVGDPVAARRWRERSGCLGEVTLLGPLGSPPLTALEAPSAVDPHGPLQAEYPGLLPFAAKVKPQVVRADACAIDLSATSLLRGLRAVVVDLDNPEPQPLVVALTTHSAAAVTLGGSPLLARSYAEGAGAVMLFGAAEAEAGRVRLVVRLAHNQEGSQLQLAVWGLSTGPLGAHAPEPGDRAPAQAQPLAASPAVPPVARPRDLPLALAALLALGRARRAAELLERAEPAAATGPSAPLLVELLRIRALQQGWHLTKTEQQNQVEAAAQRARRSCEHCWEARITAAAVAAERRGYEGGVFAALGELGIRPGGATEGGSRSRAEPPELAYLATTAHSARLFDLARRAYDTLARLAPGSLLLADVDARIHRRTGAEQVRAACAGGTSRARTSCLVAHISRGDLPAVQAELGRLRQLHGAPELHRDIELQQLLLQGRPEQALKLYAELPPATRSLATLGVFLETPWQAAAKDHLRLDRLAASDTPYALEPLARLLGLEPERATQLERQGAELVARDRRQAFLPGAATAVLQHTEHYRLEAAGLLGWWAYDLRRVSGTADVELGVWADAPEVNGRAGSQVLRRRIHKVDGRVLDPDPSAQGAQLHTELSQLEAGDYVEILRVGWALPGDDGQLVVDTPDLLPERTSIRQAEISLTVPAQVPLRLWSHRLLGQGARSPGGDSSRRTTLWRLANQAPRRLEEGVPHMESRVAISFGTDTWQRIAGALGERYRSLSEDDPFIKRWVDEAAGRQPGSVEQRIGRLVAAVGKAVKQGDAFALADESATLSGGGQHETARKILERGSGSRTWVLHRALRELGVKSRIAVAETRPFSAARNFPPHLGRFTHPLLQVELGPGKALWIDADVPGPPLPPGQISPELRGRQALLPSGELVTVEGTSGATGDELDLRIKIAPGGDGAGTLTALLHGQPAQQLASAFEVVVGARRTELLRNVVLGWLPWADVQQVTLSSDPGSWQVALRADIALPGFAQPEGRQRWLVPGMQAVHAVFPRPFATTLGAQYTAQAGRTTDLGISEPLLYHLRRRIELPAGAQVLVLAPGLEVDSPHIKGRRQVRQEGSVITEDFWLNLPVGTIPVAEFADFAAALKQIDEGFMFGTQLRLEPAQPSAEGGRAPR